MMNLALYYLFNLSAFFLILIADLCFYHLNIMSLVKIAFFSNILTCENKLKNLFLLVMIILQSIIFFTNTNQVLLSLLPLILVIHLIKNNVHLSKLIIYLFTFACLIADNLLNSYFLGHSILIFNWTFLQFLVNLILVYLITQMSILR